MEMPISFLPASDSSLLIKLGDGISLDVHKRVFHVTRILLNHMIGEFRNIHPAYNSILISFDPLKTDHAAVEQSVRKLLGRKVKREPEARVIEIPTCYGGGLGPDIADVATHAGLTTENVIRIHSDSEYTVYFLGFSPGFPYLGGMSQQIAVPRLAVPRKNVPAGSVAIGGSQTGIYPLASPGGWRIIGRTPLKLFDPLEDPPTLLQIGDRVRFVPMSESDFKKLLAD